MKTTTIAIANALRAGVAANWPPPEQAAKVEEFSEMLLEMAASLEMDAQCNHTGTADPKDKKMRYATLLGQIAWEMDKNEVQSA